MFKKKKKKPKGLVKGQLHYDQQRKSGQLLPKPLSRSLFFLHWKLNPQSTVPLTFL